jgi:hypothetical protein
MAKTAQLNLPLVMPAQAQKHVTVNEALARLDALAQLRVVSSQLTAAPANASDGESYLVPGDAGGAWGGQAGKIAIWSNGGWIFVTPRIGWRAWDESRLAYRTFDGTDWIADALAISPSGAATLARVVETDHSIEAGGSNLTPALIPAQTQVIGVSGRVLEAITGPGLSGWQLGVPGSNNRYGSGLGTDRFSYVTGLSGQPVTYYEPTRLKLTAEGGTFAEGRVRLALHLLQIVPPRGV